MSRKHIDTIVTTPKHIEEIYCEECGKLICKWINYEHPNDIDTGLLKIQLRDNQECQYFKIDDICKDCALEISGKIEDILLENGFIKE